MSNFKTILLGITLVLSIPVLMSASSKTQTNTCTYHISHVGKDGVEMFFITTNKGIMRKHQAHGDVILTICEITK